MSLGSRGPIDRSEAVEAFNNSRSAHIKEDLNGPANLVVRYTRVHNLDTHTDRIRMANDVGNLHFTIICQFRCHHAFGDVSCHIDRPAIDLTRILALKCPTTVVSNAVVRIDDDLPARQPGINLEPSDQEGVSRIDKNDRAA